MKLPSKSNSRIAGERACRPPSRAWINRVRAGLLAHFDRYRRDLPWRATADPYHIWVSEIMLQQTRVDTVRPYYDRWLKRFPDLHALAEAPLDDVLKAWEGLGYYSRARNLHAAARVVSERYHGAVPAEAAQLRELPGIGAYTAGAIASIAFNQPEPVIDGNVKRVLHRLLDQPRLTESALRTIAATLVPELRPGDFNQALMELGATICTPRAPHCEACPLQIDCRAFARGTQSERPAREPRRALPEKYYNVIVLLDPERRVLLRQRPLHGLLAGLWEFPSTSAGPAGLARAMTGNHKVVLRDAGIVRHTFSHFRAYYRTWVAHPKVPLIGRAGLRVVPWSELEHFALPAAQRRIAALAEAKRMMRDA